jgi:hypothetical protein
MAWPLPSPIELNREMRTNVFAALSKVYAAPFKFARIIFFMRTDDPLYEHRLGAFAVVSSRCFCSRLP